jgi:hypothetical protein
MHWRERLWQDDLRCGVETVKGTPCKHHVFVPGECCPQHPLGRVAPKPRKVWPRAVCTHCGKDVAVSPKRLTYTHHSCKGLCCRPPDAEILRLARRAQVEDRWYRLDDAVRWLLDWGFTCEMSNEPAEGAS